MFFHKQLTHTINHHPSYFTPTTEQQVRAELYKQVEGTISGRVGFIVCVLGIQDGQTVGKVLHGSGMAEFHLTYNALVLKVFKGEVIDAKVTKVAKTGFFAEVGPLEIFVSSYYIPEDLQFSPTSNPPAFISQSLGQSIKRDAHVRVLIIGTRMDQTNLFAIGSIKGDFMGVMSK